MSDLNETAGQKMERAARGAAREAAPWVERLARAGYATRGIVYLVIAFMAARAALERTAPGGQREALGEVERQPGGDWLLILLAIGFAGFALWRFVQAARDPEGKGTDGKGIANRIRYAVSGVLHGGFALTAYRMGRGGSGGGGSWYSSTLSPMGRTAVGAAALGFRATAPISCIAPTR
jgi:hypothetical protein